MEKINDENFEKVAGGMWKDGNSNREIERRKTKKELELKDSLNKKELEIAKLQAQVNYLKADVDKYMGKN